MASASCGLSEGYRCRLRGNRLLFRQSDEEPLNLAFLVWDGEARLVHTLGVEENRPNFFLRLVKNSKEQRLQFLYCWVIGKGRQANFDEVTFDASRRSVELARKNKRSDMPFSEFSAVRMREDARRYVSVWHVELVSSKGPRLLFLSSDCEERQTGFERTASIAKAVSTIMSLPVQVFVDGKVWTHGWPPKKRIAVS